MTQPQGKLILDYYTRHSAITDPQAYAALFDPLPRNLPDLVQTVQGLIVWPALAQEHGIPFVAERQAEFRLRTVPKMLECILALDPAPLAVARPPAKRMYGLCRDFAVLLVTMLRQQGVPARERVGFGGYFDSDWYWDHRIAEWWDAEQGAWVLVDPQIDEVRQRRLRPGVDRLHITRQSPFLLAGEAWQLCRNGQADPDQFVDSPTDRGLAMIRYALLHDFDALNKVELVGMDAWHELIDKPEAAITAADRQLLDEIAQMTVNADSHFAELQELYRATPYGQAVQQRLSQLLG